MPDGQEAQRGRLTHESVPQELQSLVNVLSNPVVRVHVEGLNVVVELRRVFEQVQLHVLATVPQLGAALVQPVIRYAYNYANKF